jgi:hypothetical protein
MGFAPSGSGAAATGGRLAGPPSELAAPSAQSFRTLIFWGVGVGIFQAASPIGFWWLEADVIWAMSLVIIASIYIGFAVADGRPYVIAVEVCVAAVFIVLAAAAIDASPWLVVIGLVGHGFKDLWQHRTHFVVNTRWWPSFCLVVDFVAASVIAVLLLIGVDLNA